MTDDIVARLRSTGGLDARLLCEAADEIERLRAERDEARAEAIRADLRMADAEFERDAARRLYCESRGRDYHAWKQTAADRGWDCYVDLKEDSDGR